MPAKTNPNITPEDGLVEGDLFELLLDPTDVDGNDVTLDTIVIKVRNGTTTDEYTFGDLTTKTISSVDYYSLSWEVGPGKSQIQAVSSGALIAVDLAYIKATKQPIS